MPLLFLPEGSASHKYVFISSFQRSAIICCGKTISVDVNNYLKVWFQSRHGQNFRGGMPVLSKSLIALPFFIKLLHTEIIALYFQSLSNWLDVGGHNKICVCACLKRMRVGRWGIKSICVCFLILNGLHPRKGVPDRATLRTTVLIQRKRFIWLLRAAATAFTLE